MALVSDGGVASPIAQPPGPSPSLPSPRAVPATFAGIVVLAPVLALPVVKVFGQPLRLRGLSGEIAVSGTTLGLAIGRFFGWATVRACPTTASTS
jgi:hypothetical protein